MSQVLLATMSEVPGCSVSLIIESRFTLGAPAPEPAPKVCFLPSSKPGRP
jgi:hypothetical protein